MNSIMTCIPPKKRPLFISNLQPKFSGFVYRRTSGKMATSERARWDSSSVWVGREVSIPLRQQQRIALQHHSLSVMLLPYVCDIGQRSVRRLERHPNPRETDIGCASLQTCM